MKITEIEHRIMVKKTQSVVAKEYSHEVIKIITSMSISFGIKHNNTDV